MGMFDDIIFEKAPVICKCGNKITDFQTKQFYNLLDKYKVTKRNKLKLEIYKLKPPKRNEQVTIKDIKIPFVIKEHDRWKILKLTDTIYCYTFCEKCRKWWFDVKMIWIKGKLNDLKIKRRKLK